MLACIYDIYTKLTYFKQNTDTAAKTVYKKTSQTRVEDLD